ncbi:MAG: hypothetical protein AAFQ68_06080 [Bacteroidota bacterium]
MKAVQLPEEKLNELAREVSESLLASHDFRDGTIRGEDLSAFTEHEQINKFLLFQVYQVWNMQLSKLKHPFFDFDQEEVQEALQDLRNLLSRHISIKKEDFQPLLQRAVYNNLKLLLDPHDAFSSFFFVNGNQTSVELFGRYVPFFSDMDFVVNSILKYCQKNDFSSVGKDTFFEKMDRVFTLYSQKSGQHIDQYRNAILQKLTGKNLDSITQLAQAEQARLAAEKQAAEEARLAQEAKAREEEEAAAKAKAEAEEAERKRLEEEVRLKAEEEARLKAEEEARIKAEEEARAREEAQRKASIFDTLSATKVADVFDIDLEEEQSAAIVEETISEESETATEEVVLETEATKDILEEVEVPKPVEEMTSFDLDEDETPQAESLIEAATEEIAEEVVEEVEAVVDPEPVKESSPADEFLEMAASMEPTEEAEAEEDKPKTILDSLTDKSTDNGASTSVLDKVSGEQKDESDTESTVSFLDRFLNQKEETVAESETVAEEVVEVVEETVAPDPEPEIIEESPAAEEVPAIEAAIEEAPVVEETPVVDDAPSVVSAAESASWEITEEEDKPASILEKLQTSSQTIADRFAPSPANGNVGTSVNGNRKIQLDEIPIHKQYQYVQKVFDGNNVRFRVIVEKVNNAQNKSEVEALVKKYILSNDSLNPDDLVVSEFITLLRNRF